MNISIRGIILFIVIAMVASLSSCSSSPDAGNNIDIKTPVSGTNTFPTSSMAKLRAKKSTMIEQPSPKTPTQEKAFSSSSAATDKNINYVLYTSDTQCQELIAQKVSVSDEKPVIGAVGKILEQQDSADFNLSGYRVSILNGVATVDFRISPHSQRHFTSLSSCEQFALFGSLRKTLTANAQWKIKDVRFTERGEQIQT